MNRSKVIVHMYVSIDGKIDGKYMEEDGCNASGEFYDEEIFKMSKVNANGATTASMYAATGEVNLDDYFEEGIEYEDWTGNVQAETWNVVFDRKGRCIWGKNHFDYANKKSHALEVVTEKASKKYLSFLRSKEIPYIIAGKEEMDISLALEKLKNLFGLDTISLCGGAVINGAFLEGNCVDEISLVVAPYVDGEKEYKQFMETSKFVNTKFHFKKANPLNDGGVQLLFEREEVNE